MIEKIKQVSIHEMSHLIIYLYMGGSADDLREMQLKPSSAYFEQRSFSLADNNFAASCVCLAGPVSDKIFSNDSYAKSDIKQANDLLERYIHIQDITGANVNKLVADLFQAAWNLTESIILNQKETVLINAGIGVNQMNNQNKLSKNKLKKISQSIIKQWEEEDIPYFTHPRIVSEEH